MTARPSSLPRRRRRAGRLRSERGASAVEFALVVPVLLVLLFGIVECSKLFQVQSTLSAAAREAVRVMSLDNSASAARAAAQSAASSLGLSSSQIAISPSSCAGASPTATVTVTISYHQPFASGFLGGAGADLTGRAVMRCGG